MYPTLSNNNNNDDDKIRLRLKSRQVVPSNYNFLHFGPIVSLALDFL